MSSVRAVVQASSCWPLYHRAPRFESRPYPVGIVVGRVALRQASVRVLTAQQWSILTELPLTALSSKKLRKSRPPFYVPVVQAILFVQLCRLKSVRISRLWRACCMLRPSHSPESDHCNIWWRWLIEWFSQASQYVLCLEFEFRHRVFLIFVWLRYFLCFLKYNIKLHLNTITYLTFFKCFFDRAS